MRSGPKWLLPVGIVVAVVVVIIVAIAGSYNGMVDKDESAEQAFADLDSQLQRRADVIPNIVETAQAQLTQEREIFTELAEARANYAGARGEEETLEAGQQVESALGRLLVIIENYPTLQSNQQLLAVQDQLEGTENRVAQARRDYNEVVTDYNKTIRRFPRNIFAGMFGFDRRELFEIEEPGDREAPEVDFDNGDDGEG